MLFAVISQPVPTRPSTVTDHRQAFWRWAEPLLADGTMQAAYPRIPRGVVAIFDVPSNEELHRHLTAWAELVPAEFEVLPLVDQTAAKEALTRTP